MKLTVTKSLFIDTVRRCDRLEQFGLDGWTALFDYIEDCEREQGEESELDVVGLCCEWTRYESVAEFNEAYGEECKDVSDVAENTCVVELENGAFLAVNY